MKLEEAIIKRRSVRFYAKNHLKDNELKKIINAGIWAPSGLNNQPWKFMVIQDAKSKGSLAECTHYGHIIKRSTSLICVFLDKQSMYNRDKDLMAIGACVQNMLLQAFALGIGTCWLGEILNKKKQVERLLKVTKDLELMALISLGYLQKHPSKGKRKKQQDFLIT